VRFRLRYLILLSSGASGACLEKDLTAEGAENIR